MGEEMKTENIKNEKIKRSFFRWLREAQGLCDATINNIERAILHYQDFTKNIDFGCFNSDKAVEFKKWLRKRQYRGKPISITTYHAFLRYLRKFFSWLSFQPGYKTKIAPNDIEYLNILQKEEREATQYVPRNYPPLEYVKKLVDSIKISSEVDMRDRALISFTLLSGMRDNAIVTLPLSCFDVETLVVSQNPKKEVKTKFSNYISSMLFNFDDEMLSYVVEWAKYLRTKGFGSQDPLFPRSKLAPGEGSLSFEVATDVEPKFWKGTGSIRAIFKSRAETAGLRYHAPHTFRHLAVDLALKFCKSGEQIKAISQSFGHKHIALTLSSYANYNPQRLADILKSLDFSGEPMETLEEKVDSLREMIKKKLDK